MGFRQYFPSSRVAGLLFLAPLGRGGASCALPFPSLVIKEGR